MQIMAEWAGHFYDPGENSDKIWASTYTNTGDYLAVWGRRGNKKYQSQVKQFGSLARARAEFEKMVSQKERKGYQKVPFENSQFGNIPSFAHSLVGNNPNQNSPGSGKITGRSLLERIQRLLSRMRQRFEPDAMLVEYQQLRATTQLVLEYAGRKSANSDEAEEAIPAELEPALDQLGEYIKQALLA